MMTADEVIAALRLSPHPEGGHFVETFRDDSSTAIYFLLRGTERSHWHQVDAAEAWHYYLGAPLELQVSVDGHRVDTIRLGPTLSQREVPQHVVPRNAWQAARSLGDYTLVGCTVAPPFRFDAFTLAPRHWQPGR